MSFESWKEEYYPVPADEVDPEDALEHSIRKWDGLSEENCHKHDIDLLDVDCDLPVEGSTCALCQIHNPEAFDKDKCVGCPLYKDLGKACFTGENSPWSSWVKFDNNVPMLEALKRARDNEQSPG